jgi:UDP-GlcNAc:undecaprenyl-phosphate/decaprenyl-phosphate GlcNAc-1-phosphate transferase
MRSAVFSLLAALVATLFLLRVGSRSALAGPANTPLGAALEKRSSMRRPGRAVPVSGLAAMVGVCAGWLSLAPLSASASESGGAGVVLAALPCVALPVFLVGLVADFWRPVPLWRRVCVTALMALIGLSLAAPDAGAIAGSDNSTVISTVISTGFPAALLMVLTVAFISSVTHAMSWVDKRNGASAMAVLLIQAGVACVAHAAGDAALMSAALVVVGAVLGLSFFSFQANLACLGRSGNALLGFITASLACLLVLRNPTVSPWLPLLLCAHPVLEALSAWQRLRRGAPLHEGPSLLYLKLVRWATGNAPDRRQSARDNGVVPHLWMLSIVGLTPAVLWWQDGTVLAAALLLRVLVQLGVVRLLVGQPPAALAGPGHRPSNQAPR